MINNKELIQVPFKVPQSTEVPHGVLPDKEPGTAPGTKSTAGTAQVPFSGTCQLTEIQDITGKSTEVPKVPFVCFYQKNALCQF